jgi:C4-dicarboxylate transporter/malic acid transport protein
MDKNKKINFNDIIRNFSPAWYAAVMGTGGFANLLYLLSSRFAFIKPISVALFFLNIFLFLILIVPWILRWFFHFDKLIFDLKHPIMSNFFVTMPVGGLILGTNFFIIGKEYFNISFIIIVSLILWIYNVLFSLIFGVFVTYNMMATENIGPELTNYSWYITPVASVIVPLLGNLLIKSYIEKNLELAKFINFIDMIFYGIGMMLFIILSSIILNRFINHKMPHSSTAPTFWILLGPIGVGTISLMGIADISKQLRLINSTDTLYLLSIFLWGFGLWAFIITLVITIKYIKQNLIPFSLSWWAFIFPLSAYALATFNVYSYLKMQPIFWYLVLLIILLAFMWIITFIKSIIGTISGNLLS